MEIPLFFQGFTLSWKPIYLLHLIKIISMKQFYIITLLLLVNLGCGQSNTMPIAEFSLDDAEDAVLVDVRTPEEFEMGHLKNALNINWFDPDFDNKFAEINKETTIYMYCKVGGRSAKAQERLQSLGYKMVINLEGGYDAWLIFKE